MAIVTVEFSTDEVGTDAWGDAVGRTHPAVPWPFADDDTTLPIGTDNKIGNPEQVCFLRYAPTGIPSGAIWKSAYFDGIALAIVVDGPEGKFRVGALRADGKWEDPDSRGFEVGVGPLLYEDTTDLPFPTNPGSDAINPGILVADEFLGNTAVEYTFLEIGHFTFGDPDSIADRKIHDTLNQVALTLQLFVGGPTPFLPFIAFVLDPFQVPAADPESITFVSDDQTTKGENGIHLFVEYDENPPVISSDPGPSTTLAIGTYTHTVVAADTPTLHFPTGQDITFALSEAPEGATIHLTTGVITWVPLLKATHTFTVVATDEDGFTDTQTWTVEVVDLPLVAPPVALPVDRPQGRLLVEPSAASRIEVDPSAEGRLDITASASGELELEESASGSVTVEEVGEGTLRVEEIDDDE